MTSNALVMTGREIRSSSVPETSVTAQEGVWGGLA